MDYFDNLLKNIADYGGFKGHKPIQPVSLLMLDINMPIVNGLQALKQIKQKYKDLNDKYQLLNAEINEEQKQIDTMNAEKPATESE